MGQQFASNPDQDTTLQQASATEDRSRADWIGSLLPDLLRETSPELAIKIAYDFGRNVRIKGASEADYPHILQTVLQPFAATALMPYLRAGFIAGFRFDVLPWRREIEASLGGEAG